MANFEQKLTQIRRDFHRDPELGFNEVRTKAKVASHLRELGLEVYEGAGVVGVLKSGSSERVVALRADMDALPIQETSTHEYLSENEGVMHACGHDGHTTMLLGAAELLAGNRSFDGSVVFIFQPNEEHGLGALAMLEEGFVKKFAPNEVYAIHNLPGLAEGQIMTCSGQICASETLFEIVIEGRGGHASMPHTGVDAITVGAEMVLALQTIVARKLSPGAGVVVSVTEFISDGQRNVLPGSVTLKGDIRARLPADRERVSELMQQIVAGVAATHAVTANLEMNTEFIETINAPEPVEAVERTASNMGIPVDANCSPISFSEDFAHFCQAVPGCFLLMGNGESGAHAKPLHASDYDFNDRLLTKGALFWEALIQDRLPKVSDT